MTAAHIEGYLQSRKLARDFMINRADILAEVAFDRMKVSSILEELGAEKIYQDKAVFDLLLKAKSYIEKSLKSCKDDLSYIEKMEELK